MLSLISMLSDSINLKNSNLASLESVSPFIVLFLTSKSTFHNAILLSGAYLFFMLFIWAKTKSLFVCLQEKKIKKKRLKKWIVLIKLF